MPAIYLQTTVILFPWEMMGKNYKKNLTQTAWHWSSPLIRSLPVSASPAVPTHHKLSSLLNLTGDTAASPRKVQLNLSGYILMKWTTSLLQTYTHRMCDIPDSAALVTSQANGSLWWSCLFFISRLRERQAIKYNWSLQQSWNLGPRRRLLSGCLIIMWPSCWFW